MLCAKGKATHWDHGGDTDMAPIVHMTRHTKATQAATTKLCRIGTHLTMTDTKIAPTTHMMTDTPSMAHSKGPDTPSPLAMLVRFSAMLPK
jgi:hypothetical protein